MHDFAVRSCSTCITCLGDAPLPANCGGNVIRRGDFYGYDILFRKLKEGKERYQETHFLIIGTYRTKKDFIKKEASVLSSTSKSLTQFSRSDSILRT